MKYLWLFVILCAGSAYGQNSYGTDFVNLHCTAPDPNAPPNFGDAPRPGLVPLSAAPGNAVLYCDAASGSLKVSLSGGAYSAVGGGTNLSNWTVSRQCVSTTNCTQVHADGRYVIDATSNSTTTVTCPNNDCNFTQADVGKVVWGTTQNTGLSFLTQTTFVCPLTTISSVNSAQSITVGTTCTSSGTANVALYWATDDGTAMASLDAAVGCANIYLPDPGVNGLFLLTSQPFLVTPPLASQCNQAVTSITGAVAPALIGTGFGASNTLIMVAPNFNWAGCKAISGASENVCIGGTARTIANIQVWGSGLQASGNALCNGATNKILMSASPPSSTIYGVDVAGVCVGAPGMIGVELNSFDENFDLGGVQNVGTIACNAHNASSIVIRESDCHNFPLGSSGFGLRVENGAQVMDLGSFPMSGVSVLGKYQSRSTHFTATSGNGAAITVGATGIWYSYGDYISTDTVQFGNSSIALTILSGGQAQLMNTTIGGSASISNAGMLISLGGNKLNSLTSGGGQGTWSGSGVLVGTCRGTATSSATLGLYQMGQNTTTACTSTTVNLGLPVTIVPISGSINTLVVFAGTGCKGGNTCVFTVLKNGVATTLTCSMSGSAVCQDFTHFDVPVAGDTYSIQFTTGVTETLANVTATLLNW